MANPVSQIVIDTENYGNIPLRMEHSANITATDSPNFNEANGDKLVTKRAVKEYVESYLQVDNQLSENLPRTITDIITARPQYEDGYLTSYRPSYISAENDMIVMLDGGMVVEVNGIINVLKGRDLEIPIEQLSSIISQMSQELNGCVISDSNADGSEDSKYLTEIEFNDPSIEMSSKFSTYRYFKTESGEYIYGYIDIDNYKIKDIDRGSFNDKSINPLPLKPIENETFLKMVECVHIFFDKLEGKVILIHGEGFNYTDDFSVSPELNDCTYSIEDKHWYVCELAGTWESKEGYIFLGDLIIEDNQVVAIRHSELQLLLDNVNNVDIRIQGNQAYTYTDRTVITVYNKLVEFSLDRIRWDLTGLSGEQFLYIDGDGKSWVSDIRPKWLNEVQYYGHYSHYWRCVGKVELDEDNKWIKKEI